MPDIKKVLQAINYIRTEVNPEFAMPQFAVFLQVCVTPGITQPELCEKLDMPPGSLSRNLKMLSKFTTKDPETGERVMQGYNLITQSPDPDERRRLACHLTPNGKKVCNDLLEILYWKEEDIRDPIKL